jgi:hypothetical protein
MGVALQLISVFGGQSGSHVRRLANMLVVVLATSTPSSVQGLEIEASTGDLSSRCCSWRIRIATDRTTTVDVSPAVHLSRKFDLSAKGMQELEALLRREAFMSLDRQLGVPALDLPESQIRVRVGDREHTVVLQQLPHELVPVWRTDASQFGRGWRVCEYLRQLTGVPEAMRCPGIPSAEH